MFKKKSKEVEVIDMKGAKVVKRKTSWIKRVWAIFAVLSVFWLSFVYVAPLYVKKHYSEPIKRAIVVGMFVDLQHYMQEQYIKMLQGIAGAIDLKKPVAYAVDKVKMAEKPLEKVSATTATATTNVQKTTTKVNKLSNVAGKLGVNTGSVTGAVDNAANTATGAINKVDDTTKMVNDRLDKIKTELEKVAQLEIDKALDEQIRKFLDKQTGLGFVLEDWGTVRPRPWKPSTWPTTNRIYAQLQKSDLSIIQSFTNLVNQYFGFVAWGLVIAAWVAGVIIWIMVMVKVRGITRPFLICPRCGHTYADKRTGFMLLKVFQPWNWFI